MDRDHYKQTLYAIQFVSIRGAIGMSWCTHTFVQPGSLRIDNFLNQACSSHTTRQRYYLFFLIVKNVQASMMPASISRLNAASASRFSFLSASLRSQASFSCFDNFLFFNFPYVFFEVEDSSASFEGSGSMLLPAAACCCSLPLLIVYKMKANSEGLARFLS